MDIPLERLRQTAAHIQYNWRVDYNQPRLLSSSFGTSTQFWWIEKVLSLCSRAWCSLEKQDLCFELWATTIRTRPLLREGQKKNIHEGSSLIMGSIRSKDTGQKNPGFGGYSSGARPFGLHNPVTPESGQNNITIPDSILNIPVPDPNYHTQSEFKTGLNTTRDLDLTLPQLLYPDQTF